MDNIPKAVQATNKPRCKSQQSFVFIKTHKSGSTTMIAPLQKYAYLHNLTTVVPSGDNNIHLAWPFKFIPNQSNMISPDGHRFQVLVNHIVYNKRSMQLLMDQSTEYITIVREPIPHLISSYQYFSVNKNNSFLRLGKSEFEKFLLNPVKNDPKPYWMRNFVNPEIKSLTRNLQSADLGMDYVNFDNTSAIEYFIREIEKDFSFILVLEKLAESLVLLKRKFCWSMQDIVHVNKNIQKTQWNWSYKNISQQLLKSVYRWNNVDSLLYRMAVEKLNKLRDAQQGLDDEIQIFNDINTRISQYCGGNISKWKSKETPQPLTIQRSLYNEQFQVDKQFCSLLLLGEEEMTLLLKCKQYPSCHQCVRDKSRVDALKDILTA